MVDKRVLQGQSFGSEIPRSGCGYARAFARSLEAMEPSLGVHYNPGLVLSDSEIMTGLEVWKVKACYSNYLFPAGTAVITIN